MTTVKARLEPVDAKGLAELGAKGKADPSQIRTARCRTVAVGRFRHVNHIRNLPEHIIDEPPALLGDDTAPNPSEAALAALGSCISVGIHANAVHRGITLSRIELELEGDINITSVWGTGDTNPKPVGFTAVRIKVHVDGDADRKILDELVAHAIEWSPVTGTFRNAVPVSFGVA